VGRTLLRIRVAALDGTVGSREEALALAQELTRRRARRVAAGKAKPRR
jgi:hypothetical protein